LEENRLIISFDARVGSELALNYSHFDDLKNQHKWNEWLLDWLIKKILIFINLKLNYQLYSKGSSVVSSSILKPFFFGFFDLSLCILLTYPFIITTSKKYAIVPMKYHLGK
jgi:hypothetical protein